MTLYLFVDQFPKHQGSVSTTDSDDILVVVEESGTGHQRTIHLFLDIFSFGAGTWISEESKIPFSITAYQHIVCCWSTRGSDNCGQWIVTVVPLPCKYKRKNFTCSIIFATSRATLDFRPCFKSISHSPSMFLLCLNPVPLLMLCLTISLISIVNNKELTRSHITNSTVVGVPLDIFHNQWAFFWR